jgi:hypothetical protein
MLVVRALGLAWRLIQLLCVTACGHASLVFCCLLLSLGSPGSLADSCTAVVAWRSARAA